MLILGTSRKSNHLKKKTKELTNPKIVGRGDHLIPIGYPLSPMLRKYDAYLAQTLFEDDVNDILFFMIVLQSFSPEYIVGVRVKDRKFIAFKTQCTESASHQFDFHVDKRHRREKKMQTISRIFSDVPNVNRKTQPIDEDIVNDLHQYWVSILKETRYPANNFVRGHDGTTYLFLAKGREFLGIYSGQSWSPEADSNVGRLIQLGDLIGTFVDNGNSSSLNLIKTKVRKLLSDNKDNGAE